jgi:hypothetical protein
MTFEEFTLSLQNNSPPKEINSLLLALWFDAKGDWEASHNIAQDIETKDGALIHAYLHRKEGDIWNADYWYRRAGEKIFDNSLQEEWLYLLQMFLREL